ncbi:MAG TPA: glycosyltransferase family 4 protein [Roseiflexaceae bacterium]|nr:glycosyltransferase family 4 protein [Roseiflexaceae bacterium]
MNSPITIVAPWYGPDTAGGAETQARQLAVALATAGIHVEVWATNGRDAFSPPQPYYPAGPDVVDGIVVRRFAIMPPSQTLDPPAVVRRLGAVPAEWVSFPEHERRLLASLPSSDDLLAAVAEEHTTRRFLFIPYPFPTTFWGIVLAGAHGSLLPCLHDEPYARYAAYRWMFRRARRVLANSSAERALTIRLFDLSPDQVVVAGEGIDLSPRGDGDAFRARRGLHGPLLMYAGRRDAAKNVPLLLRYTREYWARRGAPLTLMLSGRDPLEVADPLRDLVLDLGYLSVAEKHDAYAATDVFINPSLYESFSIVLMEAWLQGTPALVHTRCDVTREAVESSGGGLHFDSFGEFAVALDLLLADPTRRRILGERGREWVRRTCRWEDVAARTAAALAL